MSVQGSGKLDGKKAAVITAEVDVPGLYVKRVEIGADGARDIAILGCKPQDEDGNNIRIEDVEDLIRSESGHVGGRQVKITMDAGQGSTRVLFHGRIMGLNPVAQGRTEGCEVVALGLDHELRTEKLFGVWARDSDDVATHLQAVPCVFNPDGKPNADKQLLTDDLGDLRVVFNLDATEENDAAQLWTAGRMVRYCAGGERKNQVNDEPRVFEPAEDVGGELTSFEPYDVNVEGETIWGAFVRISNLCAHSVVMDYADARTDCRPRFFRRTLEDEGEGKAFEFPAAGGPLTIEDRGRLISSIDSQVDFAGVVNQIDAVAPPKLYEDDFTLKRGWKVEDYTAALGGGATVSAQISNFIKETNPETSSDWERFRHVGRRWILNETGRDDTDPATTTPYDFSALFGVDKYAVRPRPFERERAEKDDQGAHKQVAIKATWGGGGGLPQNIEIGQGVVLLDDRAGVTFTDRPMIDPMVALEANDITQLLPASITITAAVEGDQSQPFGVFGSNMKELNLPTFGLVRLGEAFRTTNKADASDVEDKAQELVDKAAKEAGERKEVGTYVSPYITTRFRVGDVITSVEGRGLSTNAVIMKIGWDFMTQETQFALQVPEIDIDTHSLEGQTMVGAGVDAATDQDLSSLTWLLDRIQGQDDLFRMLHDPEARAAFHAARNRR